MIVRTWVKPSFNWLYDESCLVGNKLLNLNPNTPGVETALVAASVSRVVAVLMEYVCRDGFGGIEGEACLAA